jgi:hypothetical protein
MRQRGRATGPSVKHLEIGPVDGRDVRIDVRWAEGNAERLDDMPLSWVGLVPDAIL